MVGWTADTFSFHKMHTFISLPVMVIMQSSMYDNRILNPNEQHGYIVQIVN